MFWPIKTGRNLGEPENCQKTPQYNCQKATQYNCQKSSQPYSTIVKKFSNDFYRKIFPSVEHGDGTKFSIKLTAIRYNCQTIFQMFHRVMAIQYNCQTFITCFQSVMAIQYNCQKSSQPYSTIVKKLSHIVQLSKKLTATQY